jgi:hypothetical protein
MDLDIFKPDMSVRYQVGMGEGGEKLDFDKHLFQPGVIVADGYSLAGKVSQGTSVYFVANQQHNTFTATAKLSLFDKEPCEVVGAKSVSPDACTFLGCGRARDEFGIVHCLNRHITNPTPTSTRQDGLRQAAHRVGRRLVVAVIMPFVMAGL